MSSRTHDFYDDAQAPSAGASARRANTRAGLTRWLSYVVLAGAAGLALTFAIELGLFRDMARTPETPLAPVENPSQITGGPSRISGFDKNKRPFVITAQKGVQDANVDTLVHLQQVQSSFDRPDGSKLHITSRTAAYEAEVKTLDLEGDVRFDQGERFRARMEKAAVDMEDQSMVSKSPVVVDIIGGTITADSLAITSNGDRIIFRGGVKSHFVTQKNK
ncbi:MAG: LPS export ABC transporter periplasmic protein LptC [Rhizobiales bacterium]|nr:LPS export ABC transporter periplasmic protein LptC [Hyphomicrobiales bacterium]